MLCTGVVVNAALVAGKIFRPGGQLPTYLGSVSIQRGQCVVTVTPQLVIVTHRSLPWSRNTSVSCGQHGHYTVDIHDGKQVLSNNFVSNAVVTSEIKLKQNTETILKRFRIVLGSFLNCFRIFFVLFHM